MARVSTLRGLPTQWPQMSHPTPCCVGWHFHLAELPSCSLPGRLITRAFSCSSERRAAGSPNKGLEDRLPRLAGHIRPLPAAAPLPPDASLGAWASSTHTPSWGQPWSRAWGTVHGQKLWEGHGVPGPQGSESCRQRTEASPGQWLDIRLEGPGSCCGLWGARPLCQGWPGWASLPPAWLRKSWQGWGPGLQGSHVLPLLHTQARLAQPLCFFPSPPRPFPVRLLSFPLSPLVFVLPLFSTGLSIPVSLTDSVSVSLPWLPAPAPGPLAPWLLWFTPSSRHHCLALLCWAPVS